MPAHLKAYVAILFLNLVAFAFLRGTDHARPVLERGLQAPAQPLAADNGHCVRHRQFLDLCGAVLLRLPEGAATRSQSAGAVRLPAVRDPPVFAGHPGYRAHRQPDLALPRTDPHTRDPAARGPGHPQGRHQTLAGTPACGHGGDRAHRLPVPVRRLPVDAVGLHATAARTFRWTSAWSITSRAVRCEPSTSSAR